MAVIICMTEMASAQPSFDHPIRLVISLAPGGATDVGSRLLAKAYTEITGRQVVVENRPGGGGTVAAMAVKQSPPDGNTLVVLDNGGCCANALLNNVGYDGMKDFKPVLMLWEYPLILVVPADSAISSVQDLISSGKSKRNGLTYGSQGAATGGHILGELLAKASGLSLVHVPFRGAAPAATEVSTGRVDMLFASYASVKSMIDGGKLRPIASSAEPGTRVSVPGFGELPSMADLGFPTVTFGAWFMILAPNETPSSVIERLHTDFSKALRSSDVLPALDKLQMIVPKDTSPQAVRERMAQEIATVTPIINSLQRNEGGR
jgi:tripartite-type tricarboxylate transporter receptor subunit TctC